MTYATKATAGRKAADLQTGVICRPDDVAPPAPKRKRVHIS